MKLNRIDLKKIMYDFNSIANRLMRVDYNEFDYVLAIFLEYIDNTEIIHDYVIDCGDASFDVKQEIQEISKSYGRKFFDLGSTNQKEIANIYSILKCLLENDVNTVGVWQSYSNSNKYQDLVKAFNDRVTMVFIRHIEGYLTKIGIDMGMDEKISYSITVNNGQVNLASDNAVINATQNNGIDSSELMRLVASIKNELPNITNAEDKIAADEYLEVIENECHAAKPKKNILKTAITALQAIKGTAEFGAAVIALVQFVQTIRW